MDLPSIPRPRPRPAQDGASLRPGPGLALPLQPVHGKPFDFPPGTDEIQAHSVPEIRSPLDVLSLSRLQIVILDLSRCQESGREELGLLRENLPGSSSIPIVILTQDNHPIEQRVALLRQGATACFPDSIAPVELHAHLSNFIRIKKGHDHLHRANQELAAACSLAEENARNKAGFLASMSHEIRTPMNGVIAMTSLLLQTQLNHEQHDFVETIRTSGESLLTIINDVLNLSKIEAGKMELENNLFNIRSCIEETLDMMSSKASEKSLELLYEISTDTPSFVVGDMTRVRQILVNLVGNAIKFTAQGSIRVQVQSEAPSPSRRNLQFSVKDTGIGIDPDQLPRLFQSFSQADKSISRQFGGTGLGLVICRGLVELMGGHIWVESVAGRGSTFRFTISVQASETADTTFTKNPAENLLERRILLIDDNPLSQDLLAGQLERWGLVPRVTPDAQGARQACQAASARPFEMVILNGVPEDSTGPDLVQSIRSIPALRSVPLLLLSHCGRKPDLIGVPEAGVVVHLNKPIKPEPLHEALTRCLSKSPEVHSQPTPARPPSAPGAPAPAKAGELAGQYPLRILLADDNLINRKVASRLLKQLGYEADVAVHGHEVLQALEEKPYDLILMDVQMPELNGLDATGEIRVRQQDPSSGAHFQNPIFIIAMTANAMMGDREKCLDAGMDDYIAKPVKPETLRQMLENYGAKLNPPGQTLQPAGENVSVSALPDPARAAEKPATAMAANLAPLPPREAPVNVERLLDFSGGDRENLEEIINLYVQQTTGQLDQIQQALQEGDRDKVSQLAHSCAGASATCGMVGIVPLLRIMENTAKNEGLAPCHETFEKTQLEFQRIKDFLANHPWESPADSSNSIAI